MKYIVRKSPLSGRVDIPGSKSHTIRALVCALLSEGNSEIIAPLYSSDTRSCLDMIMQFGAKVTEEKDRWLVEGRGKDLLVPDNVVDVGNSGTSLYFGVGVASLVKGTTIFTGDSQIRNRPADGLLRALNDLGAQAFSSRDNGKPPLVIQGTITGGTTSIEAVTSQYLSSLLLAAPGAMGDTNILVPLLNEAPYVTMTLDWLELMNARYSSNKMKEFFIPGRQKFKGFSRQIPADFSSATFFMAAAAVTGSTLELHGLDFRDSQGDKEVVNILEKMGAGVEKKKQSIIISGGNLKGGTFDLNAIPDALPALSVVACFADGETRLIRVPQARLKETDRIAVMHQELSLMGADIEELQDGLVIRGRRLKGAQVNGHHDHRVVMALAVAALGADGDTVIDTSESVSVTFPTFPELMRQAGASIEETKE